MKKIDTDVVIVGCGVAGLYCALNLPRDKKILMLTKSKAEESDSFLAQGGICVLRDDDDYESYFEDTMRAGHYENDKNSVDIMIRSSREVIADLDSYGVPFEKENGEFLYTKEGAHSRARILFHQDETGKAITSVLLDNVRGLENVTLTEHFTVVDIIEDGGECKGVVGFDENGEYAVITADYVMLATGGIGGLFEHSTNFPHLTADAVAIAINHGIRVKNVSYIQIHPTTLYTKKSGRRFLISESVRGEGAILLDKNGNRFTDELQPRDVVANAIREQMKKDGTDCVMLSMAPIPEAEIRTHFPHILERCFEEGYDVTRESVPVVPAQHYFMGGVWVDSDSKTTLDRLYSAGETSCNGVHGKNRLASNSLLESLVFAKRAAIHMSENYTVASRGEYCVDPASYDGYKEKYKATVLEQIEKEEKEDE